MLKKVVIANRGEIAVRVMRACRELDIVAVAVYSDVDHDAFHVRFAGEAYSLGGESAAESYLNIPAILDIAQRCEADAVHPGYGFLAENADFATAVADAGLTFVGPPAAAIAAMGDKISARIAAEQANVPVVPGRSEPISTSEEIIAAGEAFGWPIAIKAAFGGGGRGMKVVAQEEDAGPALESAAREALSYFGRSEVYVEKYLTWPRHVEVQVLADAAGQVLYLGDRDCSSQRRNQKIIEECPAPEIPENVRAAMGEAAVRVARQCGFINAGTVEFLYEDGAFYFLEMNTRIQVEHPVTELVTGIDLVQWQLRIASGEELSFAQQEIRPRGHAIEARINAEDPASQFAPSPGRISQITLPSGPGVRVDAGYEAGDAVSQYYDNLVAKLVVWDESREAARRRILRALRELQVKGISTTLPALQAILSSPDFISVSHSTKWIEESLDLSMLEPAPRAEELMNSVPPQEFVVEIDGRRRDVKFWGAVPWSTAPVASEASDKTSATPRLADHGAGAAQVIRTPGTVLSPLQGAIVEVTVQTGDTVGVGDGLCVLESMKMENVVRAEFAGTVDEIHIEVGDHVAPGDVLVVVV